MERSGRGREAKRVCVFYSQSSNYGISRAHNHSTLSYISTRTHTTILLFDLCHDLSALCQSFSIDKGERIVGEDSERDIKRGERPLIDNASRLVTSHTPLISSPPQDSMLTWSTWFPHPCPSYQVRKEGSHRKRPTLPSRSSCHIYRIGPCSRYPRVALLQRCT
jgi:hypothetical protein